MFNVSLCIAARAASRAACSIKGVSLSSILFSKASSRRRTSSSRKVSIQLTSSAKLQQSTRFHLLLDQPSLTGGRTSPLPTPRHRWRFRNLNNACRRNSLYDSLSWAFFPACPNPPHQNQKNLPCLSPP